MLNVFLPGLERYIRPTDYIIPITDYRPPTTDNQTSPSPNVPTCQPSNVPTPRPTPQRLLPILALYQCFAIITHPASSPA
jgi:hypothetical protein